MTGERESRRARAAALEREERRPALRGEARYLADLECPGALEVAFVRSPHAHARVLRVDVAPARAAPGVRAVLAAGGPGGERTTGSRTGAGGPRGPARGAGTLPGPIRSAMAEGRDYLYRPTDWWPLAREHVRYAGEIVAAVVAADRYLAEDAAALVEVDWDPLPAVADAASALAPGAPRVHEAFADNVLFRVHRTSGDEAAARAFASAPVRARVSVRHPRVAGLSMETCGALAVPDPPGGGITLHTSTQTPHLVRDGLAACLGMAPGAVRVVAPAVGGGFGPKMQLFPEEVLVAHLARALGRPVRWVQDRMEHLLAAFHARDVTVEGEIAADREGGLLGLRARALCDVGAYSSYPLTASLEPQTVGVALPGPYRLPWYDYEGVAAATHKFPEGAYRGVGFPLGPLVTETLMDRLAAALGLDPVEVRRRNLVRPREMPYRSAGGAIYDSGDYPALLALACDRAGLDALRAERDAARNGPRRLGIGVACFVESTGMNRTVYRNRGMADIPAFDAAVLRIDATGGADLFVSTPTQGQGHGTAFRLLLADALGLAPEAIRIHLGDTALTPYGSGTFASRGIVSGGGAVLAAAERMRERLVALAAAHLGVEADALEYREGAVHRRDGAGEPVALAALARFAHDPFTALPAGIEPALEVHAAHDPPGVPVSAGVHVALAEVCTRTGAVRVRRYVVADDCGPAVNPRAVEEQVRGAVAQGIGAALLEDLVYDENGQNLTATLADYLVPGTCDVPRIDIVRRETPSPHTALGHKGIGESGTIGAPAAVTAAVLDALGASPAELTLPLNPERVLALLRPAPDVERPE